MGMHALRQHTKGLAEGVRKAGFVDRQRGVYVLDGKLVVSVDSHEILNKVFERESAVFLYTSAECFA